MSIAYIIFYGLLILLTGLYYRDRRFEPLYLLLSFALLTSLSGLRVEVGTDYVVYENAYYNMQCESYRVLEPLWRGIILGMRILGFSFHTFLLGVAALTVWLVLYGMRRLSLSYPLGILFYTLVSTGYWETFNTIRQSLSIAIVFAALPLYINRRYWQFGLWVLVSCCVHGSSIIWLLLLPLLHIRWDWRILVGILGVALTISPFILQGAAMILEPLLPERYAFYLESIDPAQSKMGLPDLVLYNITALAIILGMKFLPESQEYKTTRLSALLVVWGIVLFNLTYTYEVANRFTFAPLMMLYVALPNLLLSVRDHWYRAGIVLVMLLFTIFTANNLMTPHGHLSVYRWIYDSYTPILW